MKFRCERDSLAEALAVAGRAATGRTGTHPVLSGLRLELSGDHLTVTGTDLELTIQLDLAVGGELDGSAVIPAKLASDIVRALPNGAVEVSIDDDDVKISAGRSKFSVRLMSVDDYPRIAEPASSAVTINAAAFGEALRQVVRAASTDEQRQVLTGVLLTAEKDGLRLVATDSYRLAVRDLPGVSVLGVDQKVLVPAKALTELQRMLGFGDELVLRLGEREVTFEIGSARVTTRLIEGSFPDYARLIPPTHPNVVTIAREQLLEAIKRMKILARDTTSATSVLRLNITADSVELKTISQDLGKATEELDASNSGSDIEVAFNPEYLSSGVEAVGTDEVTISTENAVKPAIVRGVGNDDFLYLLMPVKVQTGG